MRRARRDWAALVAEYEASGLSKSEFCRRKELPWSSFSVWYRKLSERVITEGSVILSKGEAICSIPQRVSSERIHIRFPKGTTVEVPRDFDPQALRRVLEVLEC